MMMTETPYPAWTRDGTRPWHHRTHDREIGGRTVRVWLGSWTKERRPSVSAQTAILLGHYSYFAAISRPASFWPTIQGEPFVSAHSPLDCRASGWIGIAYLPADPRPATAAWPGWRHVAHATHHWTDLLPEYERIVALPDDGLAALLEG